MRADASLTGQLPHPSREDASANDTPAHRPATGRSPVATQDGAYLIEIFGLAAGVLVKDGSRFRSVHKAFAELDDSCFSSASHAERAVHSSWTRFRHRSRPDVSR